MDNSLSAKFGIDDSDFQAGMKSLASSIDALAQKMSSMGNSASAGVQKAESAFGELGEAVKGLLPELGIAALALEAFSLGKDSFKNYATHIKAITDLGAALRNNGEKNVDEAVKHEEEFADSMQNSTNVSRDEITQLEAHAAQLGVTSDKLDDTTKAAMGLAKATGMDMDSALKAVLQAGEGNYNMLQRQIPSLRTATDNTQKWAIVMHTAQGGLNTLTDETTKGDGPIKKLGLSWEDITTKLGESIANGLNPLITKIQQFLPTILDWAKVLKDLIVVGLEPFIAAVKITVGAVNAIRDAFKGDFGKAADDFKKGFADAAKGMVESYVDLGVDSAKAWNQGFEDADKDMTVTPPKIDTKNVAGGGGGVVKETVEKVKDLLTIMNEAQQATQVFGKSTDEVYKNEITEIESAMKALLDKKKLTADEKAQYQELATALATVKKAQDELNDTKEIKKYNSETFIENYNKRVEAEIAAEEEMTRKAEEEARKRQEIAKREAEITSHAIIMGSEQMGAALMQMGQGGKDATAGLKEMLKSFVDALANFISKKGAALILAGTTSEIASGGTDPQGYFQIAEGAALTTAAGAVRAIKMASGGIVSSSTFANIGEYAGASHNPEVVAPLDKLRGMLGGDRGNSGQYRFEIAGDRLLSIQDRIQNNNNFVMGTKNQ